MKKKKKIVQKKKEHLDIYRDVNQAIKVAGFKTDAKQANKKILVILGILLIIALNVLVIYNYFFKEYLLSYVIIVSFLTIVLGGVLGYLMLWVIFLVALDYLKFKRKDAIEKILPEFFRLVASNHRAGLSFEKALWKSNKPRFGVLSQEIEIVAKTTFTKGDLIGALEEFSSKYDSKLLKRFVNILSEGLKAGSNLSDLLDDIAANATRIMNTRKDMATDIMNYIFFILVAVMIICPFMFGIGYQLTQNVRVLKSNLEFDDSTVASGQFAFLKSKLVTETGFFNKFAIMMILSNCIISVFMISMIFHGNIFYDITKIPFMLIFAYAVYFFTKYIMGNFLALS